MQEIKQLVERCREYTPLGRVASYIPELSHADPSRLAVSVLSSGGSLNEGDFTESFTMQSIVKPMILLLALSDRGEEAVRSLVGEEATGKPFDAFNYSDRALAPENINPMVNAGAIALCTLIDGRDYTHRLERLLDLVRRMSGDPTLEVDMSVYRSEKETGNKNRALAYMLKAYGMIHDDVEQLLDVYFSACSIRVTTAHLASIAYILASGGVNTRGERLITRRQAKYVNAIMMTSGMYDGSGEFAVKVGIPAKSGVGGGIMAVVPGKMGIGIYSPALDAKGNSVAGCKLLELMSEKYDLCIF